MFVKGGVHTKRLVCCQWLHFDQSLQTKHCIPDSLEQLPLESKRNCFPLALVCTSAVPMDEQHFLGENAFVMVITGV